MSGMPTATTSTPSETRSGSPSDARSGLRAFAVRNPIALFLMLVFGLGYPLMFLPMIVLRGAVASGPVAPLLGWSAERPGAFLMVALALFPAALIVSALEGGRPAVSALLRRIVHWRFGARWWAIVLLALPL